MRARALSATLFSIVLLALPACSSETSIVLVIHAGDDPSKDVTTLTVHVGTGTTPPRGVPGELAAQWWQRAELVMEVQPLEFPEGFGDRSYELLIRPSGELAAEAELMFAVVGRGVDEDLGDGEPAPLLAFRAAEDVVGFAAGEVRRIDVPLTLHDPQAEVAGVTRTDCVWWNDPRRASPIKRLRERAIVPADDLDCDDYGFIAAAADCDPDADCDEARPDINPGAAQGCDAAVDNDCCSRTQTDLTDADDDGFPACVDCLGDDDPFAQPGQFERCDGIDTGCDGVFDSRTSRPCGVTIADGCRLGRQVCAETRAEDAFGTCVVDAAAPELPPRICTVCADPTGPVDCGDVRFRGGCAVRTLPDGSGNACTTPVQQVPLPPCPIAQCMWIIDGSVNQNGWSVSLVAANNTAPGTSTAPSFTGAAVALRAIVVGQSGQSFIIRRAAGPVITLDVIGLEHGAGDQCGPVVCALGGN